ncbi:hypothetical protein BDV37DRAFT_279904 [Aspergillus pseudonomiae]|uniref:Uncharacterized protein n=1 Tax=Aspergillus pseudonomiae TaxID=1506151 RepID=A0A5N7DLQ9_9EURO|nr:uncharacterized protein BDV37DRAFT_279904 [Aspergillus pseudonomiae]KAE8407370.1 hypothetical protein BDV37DRAFT_279904 [Aspergillus pseudonomiae]
MDKDLYLSSLNFPPGLQWLTQQNLRKSSEKAVIVELDGVSTIGGMQYACATVDEPEGDLDLLAKSLEAMNAEPDESKEERTGGSGQLGKMIFSCDNGTICAIAYIPQSLKGQVDAEDWLKTILAPYNGMLVKASPVFSTGTIAVRPENGKSSREVRAEACHSAVKYLQQKGVYPDVETDSDSDMLEIEDADMLN